MEQINPKEIAKRNDPCPCGSGKKFKHCCFNVLNKVWRYERHGKCNRCGFCCHAGNMNEVCEHLTYEGDIAVCKIYGKHPEGCKSYPELPPIQTDKCGYWFYDRWEHRKLGFGEV